MRNIKLKNIQGITLIALVITIIVLLILAGVAISMLSGENGILKRASEAKTQTEKKSEEEQIKLAATEAMILSNDYTLTYFSLTETLNSQLGEGTYTISPVEDAEEWEIVVTKTNSHYTVTRSGTAKYLTWYYTEDRMQITNGKQTLTLGDEVKYDPTAGLTATDGVYKKYESKSTKNGNSNQTFTLKSNNLTWLVLGTDDDGNVLIMSTECIKNDSNATQYFTIGTNYSGSGTSEDDLLEGQRAAQYGVEELNNIAAIYGYGTGAQSARSVREEDIAKIVNPTLSSGTNVYDYGNEVTYKLNESEKVEYSWNKNGTQQGPIESDYASFTYLNGNTWRTLAKGQLLTITCTYKSYNISSSNENISDLLTKDADDCKYYWLSSSYIFTSTGRVYFGMRSVNSGKISGCTLFDSNGRAYSNPYGVRPVVSLKSDVVFGENTSNGWMIK